MHSWVWGWTGHIQKPRPYKCDVWNITPKVASFLAGLQNIFGTIRREDAVVWTPFHWRLHDSTRRKKERKQRKEKLEKAKKAQSASRTGQKSKGKSQQDPHDRHTPCFAFFVVGLSLQLHDGTARTESFLMKKVCEVLFSLTFHRILLFLFEEGCGFVIPFSSTRQNKTRFRTSVECGSLIFRACTRFQWVSLNQLQGSFQNQSDNVSAKLFKLFAASPPNYQHLQKISQSQKKSWQTPQKDFPKFSTTSDNDTIFSFVWCRVWQSENTKPSTSRIVNEFFQKKLFFFTVSLSGSFLFCSFTSSWRAGFNTFPTMPLFSCFRFGFILWSCLSPCLLLQKNSASRSTQIFQKNSESLALIGDIDRATIVKLR